MAAHQGWPLKGVPLYFYIIFFDAVACDEPMANDDLTVINYTDPALEGSVIAIECDAMQCTECHHASTCVEGRWEPGLSQISARCKGMLYMWGIAMQLVCINYVIWTTYLYKLIVITIDH